MRSCRYTAENNDPMVNHKGHNYDLSFAAQIIPTESMSLEFDFAHCQYHK